MLPRVSPSLYRFEFPVGLSQGWQGHDEKVLAQKLDEALSDAPRSGAPSYTVEEITQIVALACEPPEASDRPISHWTMRELADEAQKRKIVDRVSSGAVGHFLREAALKPHRCRYWLNAAPEDPEQFAQEVRTVCELYQKTPELAESGGGMSSVWTRKTGIQALERIHPSTRIPKRRGFWS